MIYFIQAEQGGPIKIGFSTNDVGCRSRLKGIQTGNPQRLVIRRVIEGDRFTESDLHHRFAFCRLQGEWFLPVPELCELAECEPGDEDPDMTLEARKLAFREGYHAGYEACEHDSQVYEAQDKQREAERVASWAAARIIGAGDSGVEEAWEEIRYPVDPDVMRFSLEGHERRVRAGSA